MHPVSARKRQARRSAEVERFAVRAPFRNPRLFIEVPLLSEDRLRELAAACELEIPRTLLRWYVDRGYLLPIRLERGEPWFARWQLWTLHELERARAHVLYVSDYAPLEKQDGRSWREQLERELPAGTRSPWFTSWLELVVLLQNRFAPAARGNRGMEVGQFPGSDTREGGYLRGTYARRIAGNKPLAEVGLSRRSALELRRTVGMAIERLDPASEWYPLFRSADRSKRDELKGTARLAQELYVGDRIVELYLERLTGRVQPDPSYLHANPRVDHVRRMYGRSKDYADPRFLELQLTEFGLSTASRGVVFAEGATEVDMVKATARELFGYDLLRLGIELRDLRGIGNVGRALDLMRYLGERRVSGKIRTGGKTYSYLERPPTFVYLIADREGPFAGPWRGQKSALIREVRRVVRQQFVMVFKPDFERANFTARELTSALSKALRRPIPVRDVAAWRRQRGSQKQELNAWLRDRYGRGISKPALVPFYVRLARKNPYRRDGVHFRRPILTFVHRVIRIRLRQERVRDARLRRYITSVP
jgi:hypothetical protein